MVRHPLSEKVFGITDREQDNYYPLPIRITPENFEVLKESDGTCQSRRTLS
jgi:hypothetical protein